jgi:putative ABC transport system permease protein
MLADLRYAVRLIARNPGFSAAAIITLALGIGMTTAIVSVVDAVLLRPNPFPESDRLVMIWETDRDSGTSHEPASYPDLLDFQQRSRRVERLAALIASETNLTPERGDPVRLASIVVTHELLPLLGLRPLVGRSFAPEDTRLGGPRVVLISERMWERLFLRDPNVVGRTVRLNDVPQTVIGVVPRFADFGVLQILNAADYGRGFADRDARTEVDVWAPLQASVETLVRDTHPLLVIGRLAPGATVEDAQDELSAIAADLERTFQANKARGVFVESLDDVIFGPSERPLLVLLAAVAVVLLISCVNVASLLLTRGTVRLREVVVRAALGAETRQLARQFGIENATLTLIASILGVGLAFAALRVFLAMAPAEVPRLASVTIDVRVLLVALGISAIAALAFGLVPLVHSRRADLREALAADDARSASAARDGRMGRSALVVAEIAFAVVLVVGAGLLIKSLWRLQQVDPGFRTAGVLKAEFQLPPSRYPANFKVWPNFQEMHRFNAALIARLEALPGVEDVAIAGNHPLDAGFTNSFTIVGREAESRDFPELSIRRVTPSYFRLLGVRLVRGRLLTDADDTSAPPVVLINEVAARRLFPESDALGHQIAFWGSRRTIVGIIASEKLHGLAEAAPIAAYAPLAQAPSANGAEALIVRTAGDATMLAGPVRNAIRETDPGLAVFGVEPLEYTLSESVAEQRFLTLLLGLFAGLALVLAAIGVHGVLSQTVAQRTREIAIRVALGASRPSLRRMVLVQGGRLIAIGLVIGVVLGLMFARSLESLLFGVTTTDIATFAVVIAVLVAVAMLATWLPARRALRVDPIVALRQQ